MYKELLVPIGIVAILASMLLPLPTFFVDFLLVGNLIFALILLASALYIVEPLKLSALPTILLLATLYRLALNITTTRLILGSGEAGQLIEAFGNVVIQGNLVVGTVVFLVITLVQFIVIAKGSERVAEVSARFTLDALPGKQMSIDADVRSGLIDMQTARQKRQDLQAESRFYGALDGAMKFVKGDAIAGILITSINVLGGFAIGVFLNGLSLQSALSRYTLLTVGDGLLSQIPALLCSLAAGMIVTRVVRGDEKSLANELVSQLGELKKVKLFVAVIALMLVFVPGMPVLPFLVLSVYLFLNALIPSTPTAAEQNGALQKFSPKTPPVISISIGPKALEAMRSSGALAGLLQSFQNKAYNDYGLILAPPTFSCSEELENSFCISMRGVKFSCREFSKKDDGYMEDILQALEELIYKRCPEFIDDILTRRTLDFFDEEAPELVSAVIPEVLTLTQLTGILKQLSREDISIRNFDLILQAVAEHGPKASGERELYEEVRVALRRIISSKYVDQEGVMRPWVLDPVMDLAFVKAEKEGHPLSMDYVEQIAGVLKEEEEPGQLLLVSKSARRLLSECLELRKADVVVLAHEEISDEVILQPKAQIELYDSDAQDCAIERIAA